MNSWEGPRDKEDRASYKIAQRTLWLGPQADLLVTKTLFLERDADTKIQTIESNSKNSPIPVAPPLQKVFTRFIDCCYPGFCFARKLVLRASIQHAAHLISTYPCKEIWGAKGFLTVKRPDWRVPIFISTLRSAVSQFLCARLATGWFV
jgi:hypothetical protein